MSLTLPNTHMSNDLHTKSVYEKVLTLASLWTTFASAFLIVVAANY